MFNHNEIKRFLFCDKMEQPTEISDDVFDDMILAVMPDVSITRDHGVVEIWHATRAVTWADARVRANSELFKVQNLVARYSSLRSLYKEYPYLRVTARRDWDSDVPGRLL